MRTVTLTALAILILTFGTYAAAQSSTTAGDTSKMSTTTPTGGADEESFSAYQRVTKGMKPPKATKSPDPEYPKIPADAEPNGLVVMLVGLSTKGHVELVHVLRASNDAFQESAVTTVKTWKFSPAKKDGKPVPVQITVEMHFQK
ncbi:MAG TPA: energy transducer TonB [Candidatus Angelobacter sp.]|nr:energy transducer TonB [Candidatus Angelobacter sp.]